MKIFIPIVGQFINIGDTLHRKILLSWLKYDDVVLHVYVGKAPQSFIEALGLRESDKIYTSYIKWAFDLFRSSVIRRTGFIFNPGELTMSTKRLVLESLLVPFHLVLKLRKGFVLRVGIASKSDIKVKRINFWKKIFSLSDIIFWRTYKSKELYNCGIVIPDLAFYDIDKDFDFINKNKLVISMRGDRPAPNDLWFSVIKKFASNNNLEVIVVSQVRIDNERTLDIGNRLGAKSYIWPDAVSHNQQEVMLNDLYRECKVSISDRLHVLIAAYTKAVIPVNLCSSFSNKVQDHFDVVKENNVTVDLDKNTEDFVINLLDDKVRNGFDLSKLSDAKGRLDSVKIDLLKYLR